MLKLEEIRELINVVDQSSIDEFTYETNGAKIKMKKSREENKIISARQASTPVEHNQNEPIDVSLDKEEKDTEEAEANEQMEKEAVNYDHEIVSPMVGTFYAAPNPESSPYVETGSIVNPESVVCIVEAMKLFNEIEAEVSGEIVEVLVGDGELVEYGQPLFRVKSK